MLLVVGYLVWDRSRLMKELRQTYRMRDKWRIAYVRAQSVLQSNNLNVNLSDLPELIGELSDNGMGH